MKKILIAVALTMAGGSLLQAMGNSEQVKQREKRKSEHEDRSVKRMRFTRPKFTNSTKKFAYRTLANRGSSSSSPASQRWSFHSSSNSYESRDPRLQSLNAQSRSTSEKRSSRDSSRSKDSTRRSSSNDSRKRSRQEDQHERKSTSIKDDSSRQKNSSMSPSKPLLSPVKSSRLKFSLPGKTGSLTDEEIQKDEKLTSGRGLLLYCAQRNTRPFHSFLEQGANLHLVDGFGWSALHLLCKAGDDKLVQKILQQENVLVNHQAGGADFYTPLHCAVQGGHYDVVQVLLEHEDTDIDLPNSRGETALCLAAYFGHEKIFDLLRTRGASHESKSLFRSTLLHFAASGGNINILQKVLEFDKTMLKSKTSHTGMTPLHHAAKADRADAVRLLVLEWGADMTTLDLQARTPEMVAREKGHLEVAQVLKELLLDEEIESIGSEEL